MVVLRVMLVLVVVGGAAGGSSGTPARTPTDGLQGGGGRPQAVPACLPWGGAQYVGWVVLTVCEGVEQQVELLLHRAAAHRRQQLLHTLRAGTHPLMGERERGGPPPSPSTS